MRTFQQLKIVFCLAAWFFVVDLNENVSTIKNCLYFGVLVFCGFLLVHQVPSKKQTLAIHPLEHTSEEQCIAECGAASTEPLSIYIGYRVG